MGTVVTFYRFTPIDDPPTLRAAVEAACRSRGIVGTVLIAHEGINATLSHPHRQPLTDLVGEITQDDRFTGLEVKWSTSNGDNPVFNRLKVRVRPEIVNFGGPIDPCKPRGENVDAETWNNLLENPNVVVVDTRNDYESEVGTFPGALLANTTTFREFTDFVDTNLDPATTPRLAMFCTGGIRCEKASQHMLERGFEQVYQLDGGILNYLANVDAAANAWSGECFVFDQRVTLTRDLEQGSYDQCHACRRPVSDADKRSPQYEAGVSCPRCCDSTTTAQRAGFAERKRQEDIAHSRGRRHVGARQGTGSRRN